MPEEELGVNEEKETPAVPAVEKSEAPVAPADNQGEEPKDVPYSEFKKRLEEVGSKGDAKYNTLVEKLGAYGIDIDERGEVFNQTQPVSQPSPNTQAPAQYMDKLWENTDPETRMATERTIASGFEWYDNVNRRLNTQKNLLRRDSTSGKQFAELEAEVDSYLDKVPIQDRAKNGIVQVAFNMVRGKHFDELVKRAAEGNAKSAKNKESLQTPGSSAQAPSGSLKITEQERVVAGKMGISPEDYMKSKEAKKNNRIMR